MLTAYLLENIRRSVLPYTNMRPFRLILDVAYFEGPSSRMSQTAAQGKPGPASPVSRREFHV